MKMIRKRLCSTQTDYAKLVDMDRSHLAHSETGARNISDSAFQLEKVLTDLLQKKEETESDEKKAEIVTAERLAVSRSLQTQLINSNYRVILNQRLLKRMRTQYEEYVSALENLEWLSQQEFVKAIGKQEWMLEQVKKIKAAVVRTHPKNQVVVELRIMSLELIRDKSREMLQAWVAQYGDKGVEGWENIVRPKNR